MINLRYSMEDSELFNRNVNDYFINNIKVFTAAIEIHKEVDVYPLIVKETFGFLSKLFSHVNGLRRS